MKTKVFILVGLLLVVLATAMGAVAQDATQEAVTEKSCTNDEWAAFAPKIVETANTLGKDEDPLFTLMLIEAMIANARAACTADVWTSDEYGLEGSVIGPIVFSGTLYQATLKTKGTAIVSATAIEGNCGIVFISLSASLDGKGEEQETKELLKFKGCAAYFEVDGYGEPWSLDIVKLK